VKVLRSLLLVVALLAGLGTATRAAEPLPSAEEVAKVQAALGRGAFSEAIDQLELWSDQGRESAALSFDRGVAYLGRAESPAHHAGDLGQAAAGFQEALELDPNDDEARTVLGRIREQLSEQRAKQGTSGVVARPRLLRALLGLIDENVWAGAAVFGSLLLTLGLAARLFLSSLEARLTGAVIGVVGLVFTAAGAGMAAAGQHLRQHFSAAVVIVEEARLLDAEGRPISRAHGPSTLDAAGDRVPLGSLVHISESRGSLVRIEWGDAEAWLNASQLRRLVPASRAGLAPASS
jgi:hypothetical protein